MESFLHLEHKYCAEIWIRCTSRFNAGSRIIENNFKGCIFLFLAPAEGPNHAGQYSYPFPNLRGKANL